MELWDIYDRQRRTTGRFHVRGTPMGRGEYHLTAFVWVFNRQRELLLTRRAPEKEHYANCWAATGGAALVGETSLQTVRRELREETGAVASELIPLGPFYPTCAYSTEVIQMFLARGLSFGERELDEDEFLNVFRLPLRELVEKALADPVTAEWFGGRWQVVRNENEIILPGSGTTRRPDRVMTDGERAVVVDYKFGDRETARHRKQIREYLRLLRQMGYTRTEGYLWYVRLGRTERVEEKEDNHGEKEL